MIKMNSIRYGGIFALAMVAVFAPDMGAGSRSLSTVEETRALQTLSKTASLSKTTLTRTVATTDLAVAEKLAAEKAVAEKEALEKVAVEKIAVDTATKEKLSAQKVYTERVSVEKVALEKKATATAEFTKYKAVRATADKLVATRIEAEKVALTTAKVDQTEATKLTAEKEAYLKLAAEKEAAMAAAKEKEAAAKLAAEKAAAEEAAKKTAETEKVAISKAVVSEAVAVKATSDRELSQKEAAAAAEAEKLAAVKEAAAVDEAEKATYNKAVAEKLVAEKEAAEKVALSKYATVKAAAVKATAEKLEAEKLAADLAIKSTGVNGDPLIMGLKGQLFKFDGRNGAWYSAISAEDFQWNLRISEYETCPSHSNTFVSGAGFTVGQHHVTVNVVNEYEVDIGCGSDDKSCLGAGSLEIAIDGKKIIKGGDYTFADGSGRIIAFNTFHQCSRKWYDFAIKPEENSSNLRQTNRRRLSSTSVFDVINGLKDTMIDEQVCKQWIDERQKQNSLFAQPGHYSTIIIETDDISFHIEYKQENERCNAHSLDVWLSSVSPSLLSKEWEGVIGETKYLNSENKKDLYSRSEILKYADDADYEVNSPVSTNCKGCIGGN